jgi:hypothetical protein
LTHIVWSWYLHSNQNVSQSDSGSTHSSKKEKRTIRKSQQCNMFTRAEWSEIKMQIVDPNKAYIKYQDIWTTFDPGSRALKMAIFSQKPPQTNVCNPYLGTSKQPLDRCCWNKKFLSLLVLMKTCFWQLKNRGTGSPRPLQKSGTQNLTFTTCSEQK